MYGETNLGEARWGAFILSPHGGQACTLPWSDGEVLHLRATPCDRPLGKPDARRLLRQPVDELRPCDPLYRAGYRRIFVGVEGEPNLAAHQLLEPGYVFRPDAVQGPAVVSRTARTFHPA